MVSIFSRFKSAIKKVFGRGKTEPTEIKSEARPPKEPITQKPDEGSEQSPEIKLEELRAKVSPIINLANQRWRELDALDLRSLAISRALTENDDEWGFDVSRLTTPQAIIAEATRARVFLADRTSTVQGAELYTQEEAAKEWKGQFGNQYPSSHYSGRIDQDQAKVAFAAYRRLEESEAARMISYGSENMIIAIYDIVDKGEFSIDNPDDLTEVTEMARDFLDREIGEKHRQFERAFSEQQEVGGILDVIKLNDDYFNGGTW